MSYKNACFLRFLMVALAALIELVMIERTLGVRWRNSQNVMLGSTSYISVQIRQNKAYIRLANVLSYLTKINSSQIVGSIQNKGELLCLQK